MRIRVTVGVILLIPVTLEGSFCTYTRQGKTSYNELLWAPTRCVCEFSGSKSHGIFKTALRNVYTTNHAECLFTDAIRCPEHDNLWYNDH